jgi:hypothetical protein
VFLVVVMQLERRDIGEDLSQMVCAKEEEKNFMKWMDRHEIL